MVFTSMSRSPPFMVEGQFTGSTELPVSGVLFDRVELAHQSRKLIARSLGFSCETVPALPPDERVEYILSRL